MITSEYYASKLQELENLDYIEREIIPENEPVFNVFLNTRKIKVPDEFKTLAVEGDNLAETVWFTLDRYFDGQDLAQPSKKWAVQYVNALGEENLSPITYKYVGDRNQNLGGSSDSYEDDKAPSDDIKNETTLKLGWTIHYDITKAAGLITIALRCYEPDKTDKLAYNLGTEPVTLTIKKGLNITDQNNANLMNPPRDNLSELVSKIQALYENNTLTGLDYNEIHEPTLPTINGQKIKGILTTENLKLTYKDLLGLPSINGKTLLEDIKTSELGITYNDLGGALKIKVGETEYTLGPDVVPEIEQIQVDETLNAESENPVQNKAIAAEIKSIKDELAEMSFIPLGIVSFAVNKTLFEIGGQADNLEFSWELTKVPKALNINGTAINSTQLIDSYQWSTAVKDPGVEEDHKVIFTLNATDKDITSKAIEIIFTNLVYYGAAAESIYDETFIKSLTGQQLQTTKTTSITVNAEENQYIYYAIPEKYGIPIFASGGFVGGFTVISDNNDENGKPIPKQIAITNKNNITEIYNLYKSDYPNLGNTQIDIT